MEKRTRLFSAIAALGVAALTVTACSGDSGESGGSSDDPNEVTGTLRVLTPSYPASTEGQAAFDEVVAAFNEEYPGVEIEPDFATFGTLNEKISTSLASGQPYDVLVTGIGWVPPFASQGAFLDLNEFGVTADTVAAETSEAMVPAVTYDGDVYAWPLILGAKPVALSKSAFEEAGLDPNSPPTTLDELMEVAEQLTIRDADGNLERAGFDFWGADPRHAYVALLGATGPDLYEDGAPGFDGPEGVEALDWMVSAVNDSKITDFGLASASGAPLMYTGEAAMGMVGGYIDCEELGQELCDDLVFFNLQDEREVMFTGGQVASIGAGTELPEAAWAFIEAMATPDAEAAMASMNFAVPAIAGSEDAEVVTSNPASEWTYANLDKVVFEGGAANWLDLRDTFNTELQKALLEEASSVEVLEYLAAESE
ncbi:extracellular solute-binding protein [Microbacterium aquimaris]|uniref:Extracellular solute-binding protein n=1 Tax=Microbacterium aquimaris TaxID=459816 RepID=A0ABU5N2P3_9MICO|nr:extracellular solute-binding protein [Microbacterium aquimaris]MDZ8160350.1 extracellular solute-binding protein [Microbacterium aquimaris]